MFRSYRTAIACRRESNSCPSFCHLHNNYIVSIVVVMRGVRFPLSLQIGPKTIIFFLVEFVVGSVLSNAIIHMLLCHAYWIEANLCYSRPFASQRNWKGKAGEGGGVLEDILQQQLRTTTTTTTTTATTPITNSQQQRRRRQCDCWPWWWLSTHEKSNACTLTTGNNN